jgi:hypothetical protein
MVRCRLDGTAYGTETQRYVPLSEFELWRFLMEGRHGRQVTVEAVSHWISEDAAWWNSGYAADDLEPVVRIRFERPGPNGVAVPVERFFPAETYPLAQETLLSHFESPRVVAATPGYFIPSERREALPLTRSA